MAFKHSLCAVDFSDSSVAAFQQAVELARQGIHHFYVLHVIEARPVATDLVGLDEVGEIALKLEEKATAALESLLAASAEELKGILVTAEVTAGRAFVEILNYAHKWSVDLIVLGAKGTNTVEQILVGSTAERVLKTAPCSVLIAKQSTDTDQRVSG